MINLCQFENFSCFGCCGRDYTTKKAIKESLRKNTLEYLKYQDKKEFGERSKYLRDSGICRNLIIKNKKIVCPLHPALNKGKELRDSTCDLNYFCETFKEFKKWNKEKQKKFIKFLKEELDYNKSSNQQDRKSNYQQIEIPVYE